HSGKCIAVPNSSTDNNASVVQWDIVVKDNHKWKLQAV
ncbi:RICIN domain-containing protein, partial [Microcoleus sp. D2_18a_B4]